MKRVSRRNFVIGSGAIAGAALTGFGTWGSAQEAENEPAAGQPPALPGPIPVEVYPGRVGRVVDLMNNLKLDALLLPPGDEMAWLTGLSLKRLQRPVAFLLTADGGMRMSIASFQEDQVAAGPLTIETLEIWDDDTDPFGTYIKLLKKAGLKTGKIGLGGKTWYNEFQRVHAAYPKMQFASASALLDPMREVKSVHEKNLIVSLSNIAEWGILSTLTEVRAGMTEREIREMIRIRLEQAGVAASGEVLTGPTTAEWWHAESTSRSVAPDDAIVVTFGARLHGYWGSATRQAVLGKTSGRMKMIWELITQAREETRLGTIPDISWSAVHQLARAILGSKGFTRFIEPRMGQGIGVALQEFPYISRAYHERTQIGNIVQFEPGIHTPGEYGVRSSILMEVGKTVAQFLTKPQESIIEV